MTFLRKKSAADQVTRQIINDFQSETSEITGAPDPLRTRITLFSLATMIIAAIALSSVVEIERVVTARGQITSQAQPLTIQPLETSIIRHISVQVGQIVHKGDILATLDPTFSGADVAQLEQQQNSVLVEVARLQAEINETPLVFSGDAPQEAIQMALWRARQAELKAGIESIDQQIAGTEASIKSSQDDIMHFKKRLGLVSEIEDMRRTLEQNKTGSKLNALIASDGRAEVARNLDSAMNALTASQHKLEALRSQRNVYIQQWKSKIAEDLTERTVTLNKVREELAKATKRRDLISLRAMEDAVVLEIAPDISVGSVVESAKRLITLIPLNAPLQVEVDINGDDQGFVKAGDLADIKLDAYRYLEHGTAKGRVRTISADSFTRKSDQSLAQQPFYKGYIDVTDIALRGVPPDFRLVPGMPLKADIIVGSRTILSYFLEGALHSATEGMREP